MTFSWTFFFFLFFFYFHQGYKYKCYSIHRVVEYNKTYFDVKNEYHVSLFPETNDKIFENIILVGNGRGKGVAKFRLLIIPEIKQTCNNLAKSQTRDLDRKR